MSRNDRGEHSPTVTDEKILAFIAREDRPIQTAQSVGDQFGIDRSQAYRRLQRLADDGVLEKSKVGGRAVVWWLSTESERASEATIRDVNPDEGSRRPSPFASVSYLTWIFPVVLTRFRLQAGSRGCDTTGTP